MHFRVATNLEEIVRDRGCVPATIALMNGKIKVGLASAELEEVANSTKTAVKASIRDISNVLTEVSSCLKPLTKTKKYLNIYHQHLNFNPEGLTY